MPLIPVFHQQFYDVINYAISRARYRKCVYFLFAALIISSAFQLQTSSFQVVILIAVLQFLLLLMLQQEGLHFIFCNFVSLHQFAFGTMLLLLCDFLLHFCFRYTLFRSRVIIFKKELPFLLHHLFTANSYVPFVGSNEIVSIPFGMTSPPNFAHFQFVFCYFISAICHCYF